MYCICHDSGFEYCTKKSGDCFREKLSVNRNLSGNGRVYYNKKSMLYEKSILVFPFVGSCVFSCLP